jgi:hypothetical protein
VVNYVTTTGECSSKLIVVSGQADPVVRISSVNDNEFAFGTQQGRVYWGQIPPSKCFVTKIHQPPLSHQFPVLDVKFVRQYLVYVTKTELIVNDPQKNAVLLKVPIMAKTAKLSVDGDLLLVAYNDTVQVLLFRFPQQNMDCSPLCLGVFAALGYAQIEQTNSNFNEMCDNLQTFSTFCDDVDWDGKAKEPQQVELFQREVANQPVKELVIKEISKFQIQDPPLNIIQIQTCGENIALIGYTLSEQISQHQQEPIKKEVQSEPWLNYNAMQY